MERKRNIFAHMPDGGTEGRIILWFDNDPPWTWVEARGLPFGEWAEKEESEFMKLHDGMIGPHTSVLHTHGKQWEDRKEGNLLIITPKHPDYEFVLGFMK